MGGSIEETDKGIFTAAIRECKEETGYTPEEIRIRLMTLEEVQHELFTPTIHYYKEEIFDKHIPAYWEEFILKRRVYTKGTHYAIQQIVKAQNNNITVPVITVTQTPTNILSPTTIITTQTVIQSPSTNYFNDTNAVNKLVAELKQ
ncbi:hypothetical protein C2G38_2224233 [Gigaspora rosea]|uniref:Nudix hydrolase domain-containing protein n=1 Tax=Gigaspora rosea TaxID=44941 RepID=A0A397U4P1_9GLOM|nr:hypothetical protein C2G38_2224233 [Gigaspora rosea]